MIFFKVFLWNNLTYFTASIVKHTKSFGNGFALISLSLFLKTFCTLRLLERKRTSFFIMFLSDSTIIIAILHYRYYYFDVIAGSFLQYLRMWEGTPNFFANAVNIFLIKGHNDLDKGRLFLFVNYHFKTILRNIFLW